MLKRNSGYVTLYALGLALAVFLTGCAGKSNRAILDLVPLQVQLVAEYGASNVVIELQDGSALVVTMVEDAPANLAGDLGVEKARQIAGFVCQHYGSMGSIDTVEVAFELRGDGSLADATGRVAYTFAPTELARCKR